MGKDNVFLWGMVLHYAYLGIVIWSAVFPSRRIWPPLQKWTWKYLVSWGLFFAAVGADIFMMWNDKSRLLPIGDEKYYLGAPFIIVGLLFLGWGMHALGLKRTSGIAGEFISTGPYKFTRNPQYIGDILLFLGMMVIANSFRAVAGFSLLILAFLIMPFAEELWLEETYGERYKKYKTTTPRFF